MNRSFKNLNKLRMQLLPIPLGSYSENPIKYANK